MSGIGNRFRERGYDTQKYLLPIFEKPIIKYVLDLFPDEDDINLIEKVHEHFCKEYEQSS